MNKELVLGIIGAAAWIPIIVNCIVEALRKIHYVYLDKRVLYNATSIKYTNNVPTQKTGMDVIIALNLFIYGKPYFPRAITCELKLKDGPVHKGELFEGSLGYNDTAFAPPVHHSINIPANWNININRAIQSNVDNVRIFTFFIENLNVVKEENIEYIKIRFKGRILTKTIILRNSECVNIPFIQSIDSIG